MAEKKKNTAADEAAKKALQRVRAKKTVADDGDGDELVKSSSRSRITQEELLAAASKNALPYRIFAFILWILAIGFEVFAILFFTHTLETSFTVENPSWMISWIVCLVLDLICVVIGSLLWKKGNHLDPGSNKNKLGFWLRNNLGVIVTAIAFAPFIIFALTDKKANKQSKIIAVIAAAVALVIGGLFSIDWNPVSQEELLTSAGVYDVYWTDSGIVYHAYEDCQHIAGKETHSGTVEESGKDRLCKTCQARAERESDDLSDITSADKEEDLPIDTGSEETAADLAA